MPIKSNPLPTPDLLTDIQHPMEKYLRMDRLPHIWCSGCGLGTALSCFTYALDELEFTDADVGGYVGLDPDEAASVDCDLIRAIDVAWREASNERFGFTAQEDALRTARDRGLPRADTWRAFGRSVGWVDGREWLEEDGVRYEADAPVGHLPWLPGTTTAVNTGRIYEGFFLFYGRFANCPE